MIPIVLSLVTVASATETTARVDRSAYSIAYNVGVFRNQGLDPVMGAAVGYRERFGHGGYSIQVADVYASISGGGTPAGQATIFSVGPTFFASSDHHSTFFAGGGIGYGLGGAVERDSGETFEGKGIDVNVYGGAQLIPKSGGNGFFMDIGGTLPLYGLKSDNVAGTMPGLARLYVRIGVDRSLGRSFVLGPLSSVGQKNGVQ